MGIVLGGLVEEVLAVSQMVFAGRGFGGERRLNTLRLGQLEGTLHLIGGDMVEAFSFVFLRQRLPIEFGSLQHG